MKLSEFEGLINCYDGASPEEVRVMKTIHKKLYGCSVMVKGYLNEAVKIGHVREMERTALIDEETCCFIARNGNEAQKKQEDK